MKEQWLPLKVNFETQLIGEVEIAATDDEYLDPGSWYNQTCAC